MHEVILKINAEPEFSANHTKRTNVGLRYSDTLFSYIQENRTEAPHHGDPTNLQLCMTPPIVSTIFS